MSGTLDGSTVPYVIASGSVITEQAGDAVTLLGTIDNLGSIELDATGVEGSGGPSASAIAAIVVSSPTVMLIGTGVVSLVEQGFDVVYGGNAGTTLINAGNTIEGAGNVDIPQVASFADGGSLYPFTFINEAGGVVDGIGSGYTITAGGTYIDANELGVEATTLDNAGLLEATGAGGLDLVAVAIENAGGTILALGTGDPVYVQADVNGGLIEAAAGGVVDLEGLFVATSATSFVSAPATLAGVTLQTGTGGTIVVPDGEEAVLDGSTAPVTITADSTVTNDGGTLVLTGTIDDLGTLLSGGGTLGLQGSIDLLGTLLSVGSTAAGNVVSLLTPDVTLEGGGVWSLNGALVQAPSATASTLVVTDATIEGSGDLGYSPGFESSGSPLGLDNEAGGVIEGDGLQIYGGSDIVTNAGLIETSGSAGIAIQTATFDNAGGTLLADGGTIDFTNTELFGGTLQSAAGGGFVFTGTNTLGPTGGANGLTFNGSTVGVVGVLPFGGTLDLLGPSLTLYGADTIELGVGNYYPNVLDAASGTSIVNADDSIVGGQIGDGSTAWSLTNDAGGTIVDANIELPGSILINGGLLEADGNGVLQLGSEAPATIDNAGGTILATGGGNGYDGYADLVDVDLMGGTLASNNGGTIELSGNDTLDGSDSPITIDAGTTVQAYVVEESAPFYFNVGATVDLVGTIHSLGTLAEPTDPGGGGSVATGYTTNNGLFYGSGAITNAIINDGTILAQGGTLDLNTVTGTGSLAIDGGATLLVDQSTETADFQGQAGGELAVQTGYALSPDSAFTGGFANLVVGDTIDLIGQSIQSAAPIDGGSTLAVTLVGGTTLDYGLSNLEQGASFLVEPAFAVPTETYAFSYTDNAGDFGTGSFSAVVANGTADLADLTAFSFTLINPYFNPIGFPLSLLQSFSATFGQGDTLTSLSLTADGGTSPDAVSDISFAVQNLGSMGAYTSGDVDSVGSITVAAPYQQLSELVAVDCFAAGTRIATARGMVAVEDLAVGDSLPGQFNGPQAVIWIGQRRIECRRHPQPDQVWPVRIAAHAFGPGLPTRALWLSPDHALFLDGVLIPVKYLVDGSRIIQRPVDRVTYYHVELPRHDLLLAEGLAAESYLDCGRRGMFANFGGAIMLHPDFATRVREAQACAPLVVSGPVLDAVRRRLAGRRVGRPRRRCA